MEFHHSRPIYEQIVEEFKKKLIRKDVEPGEKIPSQRELAQEIKVNPNTVQRAYREMENEGITQTLRGKGTFIVEDRRMIRRFKKEMGQKTLNRFLEEIEALGYKKEEIPSLVQDYIQDQEDRKDSGTE
ncbi:GntR family transcriptional regulator [Isachenkonia alkalipeptolytica]|uniref:GntR family transcriptional regulator n=1 Tax=Isachenkonia alkalipeptolytica TaxID=2565777 RepID=A0AA43XJL6_9CLOT|nr:GntR family transcriptional regulator [Isachenkonia alkalipeptolytica]NBG87962.1 GntR family transcriptional regulator [Isachenkonia alkalipeptolytica]